MEKMLTPFGMHPKGKFVYNMKIAGLRGRFESGKNHIFINIDPPNIEACRNITAAMNEKFPAEIVFHHHVSTVPNPNGPTWIMDIYGEIFRVHDYDLHSNTVKYHNDDDIRMAYFSRFIMIADEKSDLEIYTK